MGKVAVHLTRPAHPIRPPVWALASATAAPVFLIGGWSLAQAVQPPGYDPVRQTISALARAGLDHRWIMTVGLAGLGSCHLVTAAGLPMLRATSRLVLALAGLATIGVAMFAEPFSGSSTAHVAFATTAFVLLALWPATTLWPVRTTRSRSAPAALRPPIAIAATVVSSALLIWVGLSSTADLLGLAERLLAAQQACWPLVVVLALWGHARRLRDWADD